MGPDRVTFLARLSAERTPQACSWREWKAWADGPQYHPCLAREALGEWLVELTFTGTWSGPKGKRPKFFRVVIVHPGHSGVWGKFQTYQEAHSGLHRALEECWRRAHGDLSAIDEG
jgi:hypothetical protein